MIVINRNLHLHLTIVLIIVMSSDELSLLKNRGLREVIRRVPTKQDNKPKTQSDLGSIEEVSRDLDYYHRNNIGRLNNYYQKRSKLREEYDAIQKSMLERNKQNRTMSEDVRRRNIVNIQVTENPNFVNVNSLQAFQALNPDDENSVKPSRPLKLDSRTRGENSHSDIQNNNTETGLQNKAHVKMGECKGSPIYNQNLLINSANYEAMNGYSVDMTLEGMCITCVEIKSRDNKEIKVRLTSGGPGKGNISLKFEGFDKSADFSYTLKISVVRGNC